MEGRMAKRSEEWKKYIKEIKLRINDSKNQENTDEVFYLNNKKLSSWEIDRISNIVIKIATSKNFVPNPIGLMVDRKVYDSLDNEKKIRYILDLSAIYLTMSEKYKNKN